MNPFTTLLELSNYDSQNLFIEKDSFFEQLLDVFVLAALDVF